jgi:short-chain fatty acids transporter
LLAGIFVNWGCGLVVAGLLAREIAKRITIDFGWLVAGAYSGWIIWASGLSSSIAVQGPFAVPAAAQLHTSQAATAMAVAMGEQVTNMIQPFWALPVLAIAGISLRRVMGFTVTSFFVGAIVYGVALLILA